MHDATAIAGLIAAALPPSMDTSPGTLITVVDAMATTIAEMQLGELRGVVAGLRQHQLDLERRQKNILIVVQQLTIHLLVAIPHTASAGISGVMSEVGRLLQETPAIIPPTAPPMPTPGSTPFLDAIK